MTLVRSRDSSFFCPQIALVSGLCTAGGAYAPTMSDVAIITHRFVKFQFILLSADSAGVGAVFGRRRIRSHHVCHHSPLCEILVHSFVRRQRWCRGCVRRVAHTLPPCLTQRSSLTALETSTWAVHPLSRPPLVRRFTSKCGSVNISSGSGSYLDVFMSLLKIFLSNRQVPVYH